MINIDNLKVNLESHVLQSKNIIIVPHKIADFDAIGSALGLTLAVRKLKRISSIIIDDRTYELDRGVQSIIKDTKKEYGIINSREMPNDKDLFILTDVNKSYLTTISDSLTDPDKVIIIDHHESDNNTINSNNMYIDPNVSSASEIISKLLLRMKVKIPSNIANYLLAGIYLDTNKLTKNVSADTLFLASKLLELGANTNYVMELFSEDFDSDRRVQDLVNRTKMLTYKIAMMIAEETEEYTSKELARTADYGLNYGVDASVSIGRLDHNIVGVSARSKKSIDVGKVMQQIGGGGNPYSGAAKVKDESVEEVAKKIELVLRPNFYVESSTIKR